MKVLKKVTFYYNRDRYEGFSKVVKVEEKMSNVTIVTDLIYSFNDSTRYNLDMIKVSDNSFYNSFDDIITDFEIELLDIIDLT